MRRETLPARPIRILCLIASLDAGGAQRAMTRLVGALAERHHVTVMTYEGAECAPFYPLPPSVQLVRADLLGGTGLKRLHRIAARLPAIRRLVRQTAPAVVLSFMDTMNITAIAACLGTGIPVVVSERTDPHCHRIPRLKSWLRLLAYAMADRIAVQTARVRRYFPSWLHARMVIIPNPAPTPARQARPEIPGPGGRFRLVGLGRLEREKGFDRLVAAFGLIAQHHPQWDLVIFGEGTERAALTQQAAELGRTGQIFLPGLTRDAESELTASHLIAVPSRYEGFPNTLAEAVAAGLPVVAFAGISGVEELVVPDVTGLLADEAKAEENLSAALDRLMTDAELRRKFGAAGCDHARKWDPAIIHEQWEHVLFAAIEGTPS